MTVQTAPVPASATAAAPGAPGRREGWRWWVTAWLLGWPAVTHLILTLVLAIPFAGILSLTLSGVFGAPSVILLPFVIVGLALGFVVAAADRRRLYAFTGHWVAPWPSRPPELPLWRRLLFDARPWRAQLYLLVMSLWGLIGGLLALVPLSLAVVALLRLDELAGSTPFLAFLTSEPWRSLTVLLGASVLLVLPPFARLLVYVDWGIARLLIGTSRTEEVRRLSDRVDTLTQTRQAAMDSVDAERRRIERDLHDGPQQRLVAVAMDLGLARQRLADDPQGAAALLERAHTGAKDAITEMRRVAQGIHPPVLTDRGLDAALSALAARSPVPVSVRVDLRQRPAARLEAIAYFCVSEALTNVAKHARARSARVRVEERYGAEGRLLVATVTDDGVGGADPSRGSGLAGLRDRVAAVDGRVLVSSPAGGPTVVSVELPFAALGEQPRSGPRERAPGPPAGTRRETPDRSPSAPPAPVPAAAATAAPAPAAPSAPAPAAPSRPPTEGSHP